MRVRTAETRRSAEDTEDSQRSGVSTMETEPPGRQGAFDTEDVEERERARHGYHEALLPRQFTTLLKWLGWTVLLLLLVNYWLVLFVPFYREGIFRMRQMGWSFEGGVASGGQLGALACCMFLGLPLLLVLTADLLLDWKRELRPGWLVRLFIYSLSVGTLVLSIISLKPLLLWTFG
jgi:hypothetical protein